MGLGIDITTGEAMFSFKISKLEVNTVKYLSESWIYGGDSIVNYARLSSHR